MLYLIITQCCFLHICICGDSFRSWYYISAFPFLVWSVVIDFLWFLSVSAHLCQTICSILSWRLHAFIYFKVGWFRNFLFYTILQFYLGRTPLLSKNDTTLTAFNAEGVIPIHLRIHSYGVACFIDDNISHTGRLVQKHMLKCRSEFLFMTFTSISFYVVCKLSMWMGDR